MSEGTLKSGRWWIGVTAGAVLGLGGIVAVEAATQEASAQSATFRVTPEQLRINQRISQAAVRRVNELVDRLMRGLTGDDFRDGTIGASKLASSLRGGA